MQSIIQIVERLNNENADGGGLWLPKIQRNFVWSEDQIYRLFDSVLRGYPISTMLFWRTNSNISFRKFIDLWEANIRIDKLYSPATNKNKTIVLDGQQRLQSFLIGLKGKFEKKELYLNILSGVVTNQDVKYIFKFSENSEQFPFIKFRDIVYGNSKIRLLKENIISKSPQNLMDEQKNIIEDNIDNIVQAFKTENRIIFQEIDTTIENTLEEDDIVEIFIRANSGGTKLGKSDLLFSLLINNWEDADQKISELLESINKKGYDFDRDFILKTCLVLLNMGAAYKVDKFRKSDVKKEIEEKWDTISKTIKYVVDFVHNKTFIKTGKALSSKLVLIPVIYFKFYYGIKWKDAKYIDQYIIRCLLTGVFGGHSDGTVDGLVNVIKKDKDFIVKNLYKEIKEQGKSIRITEDNLFGYGCNSKYIHLVFNLWYDFDYNPSFEGGLPQVDHIFPRAELREKNPETNRYVFKYPTEIINQLANCMLLTREENGAGGKSDTLPEIWFANKNDKYLDLHLIPRNKKLWELNRFEDFIKERKKLIKERFDKYLSSDD